MTYVKGRESIYEWLPPDEDPWKGVFHPQHGTDWVSFLACNIVRKYGKPFDADEFAARMIERVRKFGFNSGGAFGSPSKPAREAAHFPYVSSLPLSQWPNLPRLPGVRETFDPFDVKIRTQIEKNFAKTLPGNANNPLCIGYFITNEPLYEDVPRVLPTLSGKYACKREFVKSLEAKYATIGDFNKAWNLKAESFEALNDLGLAVTTPQAAADVQAFMGVFFDTYYKFLADTFHKHDTNHMLLGNRFQAGTINNEQLCRIAGKYLDVMSFNYYTMAIDKAFLGRIYSWTGRPMILSEFYYDSPSDSGLRGGVKDVKSQQERGLGYRNYIEQTASLDFIVGAEWYTLTDASTTGVAYAKYGGENPNSGLFSNVDRPWKPMIAEMVKTNYAIYPIMLGEKAPFAWDDPRFAVKQSANKQLTIYRAAGTVKMDGTAAGFPGMPAEQISGQRLVVGTDAGDVEASFKLCWDDANLYALVNVTDGTPMQNKATGAGLWTGDAVELFIGAGQVDQDGATLYSDRHFLLGAGLDEAGQPRWHLVNSKSQPACRVVVVPNVDGKGYTLEAAIPFDVLGFVPRAGQTVRFDMAVDDSANGGRRLRQIMWNGNERNSSDRTAWGRAVFGQ
jgi:hypothetical protein